MNLGLKNIVGNMIRKLLFLVKQDLEWWRDNLADTYADVSVKISTVEVTCDASNSGWDGWVENRTKRGQ